MDERRDNVEVTPAMVVAGVGEFLALSQVVEADFLVRQVYTAMERERARENASTECAAN